MGRPPKPDAIRDLPQTNVRMAVELRAALAKQAAINGRSLNMEITTRLRDSLAGDRRAIALHGAAEPAAGVALSETQRMLLARFARLTPDKQLALLQLLTP